MVHMKRYSMPKFWGMRTKEETFAMVARGPHPKNMTIPLGVVLRNVLGYAGTRKEAKKILHEGKVLVNKKAVKSDDLGIGLMDIIEIPDLKKVWRVELVKGGLALNETKTSGKKLCRVQDKTPVRGKKLQINLHDGRNIILADAAPYKTGDSLQISVPDNKILAHLPLKKGADVLVTAGNKMGMRGSVEKITERKSMLETSMVSLKVGGQKVETLKDYVFVIGGTGKEAKE